MDPETAWQYTCRRVAAAAKDATALLVERGALCPACREYPLPEGWSTCPRCLICIDLLRFAEAIECDHG